MTRRPAYVIVDGRLWIENLGGAMTACGIKHGFGDQTCIREQGHGGLCRCRSYRGSGGTITFSRWQSKDGKFSRHVSYETIYPANAQRIKELEGQ